MKGISVLILVTLFVTMAVNSIYAQSKKLKFLIGPEFSVPTFSGITSTGIGGGISLEHFFNRKITATADISYYYFKGKVFDFYKRDTIRGFSIMPVLFGVNYFLSGTFYISGSAGLVIGLHNAGNHLALSPGIGLLMPVSATSKIDVGIKLVGVPAGYSFSENNFLNKGGYSFLVFKTAYAF